jgi:tetratricopeptide (TPR) repeat protein
MMEAEDSLIAGNYAYAELLYKQLTDRNSDEPGLFFSLAVTRGFAEDAEGCGEALLRAFQLDGAYLRGIFQLASVLAASGRFETGEQILSLSILNNIISPFEMYYQKGLFYLAAGRPRSAVENLKKVANQRPNDFAFYTVLYRAYRESGDSRGMASTLNKLISLDDARVARDMPWVYRELGKLLEDSRLLGGAADFYEKYLGVVPDDPEAADLREKIKIFRNQ